TDLTAADVERLVALRLGVDRAPEELVRFVRERAGGHPLFVEEVLKGLQETGAVTVAEKRVVAMKLVGQELALPKTLRGLVASRVICTKRAIASARRRTSRRAASAVSKGVSSKRRRATTHARSRCVTCRRAIRKISRSGSLASRPPCASFAARPKRRRCASAS